MIKKFLVILVLIGAAALFCMLKYVNNMGATEARAYVGMSEFFKTNSIDTDALEFKSCAGDSDGDGYGSCTFKLADATYRLHLQCPTDWIQTNVWGATSCKVMDTAVGLMYKRR